MEGIVGFESSILAHSRDIMLVLLCIFKANTVSIRF